MDPKLRQKEAAKYLGWTEKTLANWQFRGEGPPSVRIAGRRFYFQRDLDAFLRGENAAA